MRMHYFKSIYDNNVLYYLVKISISHIQYYCVIEIKICKS